MAKIDTLVDTFGGTLALWSVGASGATIIGGAMNVPYSGGTAKTVNSASNYELTGSRIFVQMSAVNTGETDYSEFRLIDSGSASNYVGINVTSGTLGVFVGDSGGSDHSDFVDAYSSTRHAWWQIAESGGVFTIYVSPDGTAEGWRPIWAYDHTWTASSVTVRFSTTGTAGGLLVDNVNSLPTTAATIIQTIRDRPDNAHGITIGHGSWRFGVELLSATGAVYGTAVYGTAIYGGAQEWLDITDVATGVQHNRGTNTLADRPNPGTAALTVDNSTDLYSPWKFRDEPYFGPGATVRWWLNNPDDPNAATGWLPLYCGVIEQVQDPPTDADAYRFVTATLVEPHSELAKVNGYEQTPVGSGEQLLDRVARLLAEDDYRFGTTTADIVVPPGTTPAMWTALLASTNLAQNRLTEIYLTVDSADSQFVSAKSGRPQLLPMPTAGSVAYVTFHNDDGWEYPALGETEDDSLDTDDLSLGVTPTGAVALMPWVDLTPSTDNEAIVNKVALARTGGTVQTALTSPARTGPATFARSDLILSTDPDVAILAQRLLDRLANAGSYCTVNLDAAMSDKLIDYLGQVDLYQPVELLRVLTRHGTATPVRLTCLVLGYSMAITPRTTQRITWTASLNLQVVDVNDYP